MFKICSKCKVKLEISNFSKQNDCKSGYKSQCKRCIKQYHIANKELIKENKKLYYESNREHFLNRSKIYQESNIHKIRDYQKSYRAENKNEINEYKNEYQKTRRNENPQFRMICLLRSRVYNAARGAGKWGSAIRDLGIPIDAFLVYLNLDCLDKYGEPYTGNENKYEIDHIRPLSSFDLTNIDDFLKACHWSNLQILTILENRKKGSTYERVG